MFKLVLALLALAFFLLACLIEASYAFDFTSITT